jgi:DNA replication and repair protein RecF
VIPVRRLALSHFRSHRATRLAFDRPITAIHGPNGAGKTNVLEALSLLSPGRGMRRAAADELIRRPEAIGWRVLAEVGTADALHEVELRAEPGQPRTTQVDGKPRPQIALARLLRVLWLTPAMDRLWSDGAEARRRFLDRATLSFDPAHGDGVLAYEKAMRDRNRLLRDGRDDPRWFDALEAQMAREGAALTARRLEALARLARAQEGAETAFPAARLALLGPEGAQEAADEGALAEALAASRRRDLAAARTLVGPHRADLDAHYADKGVPARDCSTGEQKALLVSLVLANARALAAEGGLLLLLDEVAAHLDAGRRAALYAELRALDAQVMLTGTGPELFAELGAGARHLRMEEAGGESRAIPLPDP